MIRAFFAIDLPSTIKQQIDDFVSDLQQRVKRHAIHWVKQQHLHITLQFLEAIEAKDMPEVIAAVHTEIKTISAFNLHLGPMELFPTPYRPKIISLVAKPNESLAQLSAAIGRGMTATGYAIETRPFRGHLTLGRINVSHTPFVLPEIALPAMEDITVRDIVLFRSEPRTDGSRYTLMEHFTLKD